jgi:hypothetical protein
MPRLVVLEFQDNNVAEDLVKYWIETDEVEYEVVGVYARPTLFCSPNDGHRGGRKTQSGWTRGTKYGWWVCGVCKKPSKLWGGRFEIVVCEARNLLKGLIEQIKEEEPV